MRHRLNAIAILCIIFTLFLTPTLVFAAPAIRHVVQQAAPDPYSPEAILLTLRNMGGLAALVAVLVNVGKKFLPKLFPDGSAPMWSLILNLAGMILIGVLQITGRVDLIPVIDEQSGTIATILTSILVMVYQLLTSKVVHDKVLSGLPLIGKSYTESAYTLPPF